MDGRFRGFEVTTSGNGVATVLFNQPEHLNGTTQPMKRDLTEAVARLQMNDAVRVVIVTGSGRAFCAGDDISGRPRDYGDAQALAGDLPRGHSDPIGTYDGLRTMSQSLVLALRALDKPTIAALNGLAIQTGLSIALACDFRIAAAGARLGSATLRFGLLPDEGGHALVVEMVGLARALDFFLLKRMVSADEARELGLVHEVVPAEQLQARALELADELAAGPQTATRMLKRALYNTLEMPLLQAFDDIASRAAVTDHHPDAREGIAAFREKRVPRFEGR